MRDSLKSVRVPLGNPVSYARGVSRDLEGSLGKTSKHYKVDRHVHDYGDLSMIVNSLVAIFYEFCIRYRGTARSDRADLGQGGMSIFRESMG